MNLLGKICVILILVLSLLFMALSMAVYSTHTNWKTKYEAAEQQRQTVKAENEGLIERHARIERRLQAAAEARASELAKAEGELGIVKKLNEEYLNELATLRQTAREAVAAMSSAEQDNEKLLAEMQQLSGEIQSEQTERDNYWQIAKNKTLEVQQAVTNLRNLKERQDQLLGQVGNYRDLLRSMGANPDSLPLEIVPRVEGQVLAINRRNNQQLIEVSIGSDDGLKRNHEVVIYRGKRFLGKAVIESTNPDRAVGRITFLNFGNIQAGDRVATKLRST